MNDDEAVPLLRHAVANDWNLRFIEQMPLDAGGSWDRAEMITVEEIFSMLSAEFGWSPCRDAGPRRRRSSLSTAVRPRSG